jgi:ATP-dependent DNA helicase RecG
VGDKVKNYFAKLHVFSVEDLFNFAPRALLDLSDVISIAELKTKSSDRGVIRAEVQSCHVVRTKFKHMWITEALLSDESGSIKATWFNQPYLKKSLQKGTRLVFVGEVIFDKNKKQFLNNPEIHREAGIFPIYPQTKNLSSRQISNVIKRAIDVGYWPKEYLDDQILKENDLLAIDRALISIHFPRSEDEFKKARSRFFFDSLLKLVVANLYLRAKNAESPAPSIEIDKMTIKKFLKSLPFELTSGQISSIDEIVEDLKLNKPMNRIVQGDVGSGKTVVALLVSLLVVKSGYKVAWVAPTQILASQHFETAKKFLANFDINIELVTSASKKLKADSQWLSADLFIGTHALLQKDIKINKLGLVVVDEQHRFGVEQRSNLIAKLQTKPHFLSLSATPIPRTLSHVIYGNLDLSVIKSKPKDRLTVKSFLIPEGKRKDSYTFIKKLVDEGQQAFVVCPLIESNSEVEVDDRKTVLSEVENLKKTALKDTRIAFLHGKMKPDEKNDVLKKMQSGEIDVLVSTSVVEVGIDIKGATVMLIEDADRFGLSQLHQFRGRVGRSDIQSYCFCFTKNIDNPKTQDRLKAFVSCSDGFELAEMDLNQRGPGAIFGQSQSGFKGLNPLWFADSLLMKKATKIGEQEFKKLDKKPDLKKKVLALIDSDHLE